MFYELNYSRIFKGSFELSKSEFCLKQGRKISDFCLKQGQGMRGRAAPPYPRIYRVPPPLGATTFETTSNEMSFTSLSICINSFPVSLFFKGDPENKFSIYFGRRFSVGSFAEKGNRKRRQIESSLDAAPLCPGGMDLNTAYQICSDPKSECKTRLSCSKSARCGLARRRRSLHLSGCWNEHIIRRVTECCEYFCENVANPNNGTADIFQ